MKEDVSLVIEREQTRIILHTHHCYFLLGVSSSFAKHRKGARNSKPKVLKTWDMKRKYCIVKSSLHQQHLLYPSIFINSCKISLLPSYIPLYSLHFSPFLFKDVINSIQSWIFSQSIPSSFIVFLHPLVHNRTLLQGISFLLVTHHQYVSNKTKWWKGHQNGSPVLF